MQSHRELLAPCLNNSVIRQLVPPLLPDSTITTIGARLNTPARKAHLLHPEHPETAIFVGSCPLSGLASSTSITRLIIQPLAMLGLTSEMPYKLRSLASLPLPNERDLP